MTKNTRKPKRETDVGMGDTAEGTASVGSEIGKKISHVIALARSDVFQKRAKGEESKFEWLTSRNVDQHMTNQEKLLTRYPDLVSKKDELPAKEFLVVMTEDGFSKDELIEKLNEILSSLDIQLTDDMVTDLGLASIGRAGEQKKRFYSIDVRNIAPSSSGTEDNQETDQAGSKITGEFEKMVQNDGFLRDIDMTCAFGDKNAISKKFGASSTQGFEDGQRYFSVECPQEEVQGVQMGMIVAAIASKLSEKLEEMGSSQYSEGDIIKGKSNKGKPTFSVKV